MTLKKVLLAFANRKLLIASFGATALTLAVGASTLLTPDVSAQTTRPRRVRPAPTPTPDTLLGPAPKSSPATNRNSPLLDVKPARPVGSAPSSSGSSGSSSSTDTTHAFQLLQQKQYAAAASEAKQIAAADASNSEAWKIAGFSEFYLKQYADASKDLQKALDLQRAAKQEDFHTVDALAESYVLSEKYEEALPLLVSATSRTTDKADSSFLYYRGLAEFKTGKAADAERSFNAAVKANPKDAASLMMLAQIALGKKDLDTAISMLNRATVADPRQVPAWSLLTRAYLSRAATSTDQTKANADYLSAIRAGETLTRLRSDEDSVSLYGRALIGAQQYPRAALALEKVVANPDAGGTTLYLYGVAQSRANVFPKAIAALERALAKSPNDVNVYRELGYDYEKTKQYPKAFALYQKAVAVAPNDQDFKDSLERVRPFAN